MLKIPTNDTQEYKPTFIPGGYFQAVNIFVYEQCLIATIQSVIFETICFIDIM